MTEVSVTAGGKRVRVGERVTIRQTENVLITWSFFLSRVCKSMWVFGCRSALMCASKQWVSGRVMLVCVRICMFDVNVCVDGCGCDCDYVCELVCMWLCECVDGCGHDCACVDGSGCDCVWGCLCVCVLISCLRSKEVSDSGWPQKHPELWEDGQ